MNLEKIKKGLSAKFEKERVVFWLDSDREFIEQLEEFNSNDFEIINLDDCSHFAIKKKLEIEEPNKQFLLYSNLEQSEPTRDWLYDIKLYAEKFYADSRSLILNELGMRMEFRQLVGQYKSFFSSKQRLAKLKQIIAENANKDELEISMISVLLKTDTASLIPILQQLMSDLSHNFSDSEPLIELEKFGLLNPFWQFMKQEFGYRSEEPTLKELVFKLIVTDCYHGLATAENSSHDKVVQDSLADQLLPMRSEQSIKDGSLFSNSSKRAAVINFVSNWRENRSYKKSYNIIANEVEARLDIRTKLSVVVDPLDLVNVDTFEESEQKLIGLLAKNLPAYDSLIVEELVTRRLAGHWCHSVENSSNNTDYTCIYRAILAAKQFYDLKDKYVDGFNFDSAKAFYEAYVSDLNQMDYAYRVFSENAMKVSHSGSDILKLTGLVADIEGLYVDWYLHDMAVAWGKLVDKEKLLDTWKLTGVSNQYDFYKNEAQTILSQSAIKRVFVIISDALRYEVANEIHEQINDEKRLNSKISSQLGVVPSYTQLGMASLLPHKSLSVHLKNKVEINVDGQSAHGHPNRQKVLAKYEGVAFKSGEVLTWTNQEGREKVKDAKVVYIYHDEIDAIGDKLATEDQTFDAARNAIKEIKNLVNRIINKFNGTRVIVTADHGFIYKSTDVTDSDKTALKAKPNGAVEAKKRYIIGDKLPNADFYWKGKIATTAHSDEAVGDAAEFIVPRGSNRFNFVGGAKFIHGGIMPQEICVPILQIRELKTKAQSKLAKQMVGVVPLSSSIKLVTNIDRIQLLQTDPVGEKFKKRSVDIYVEDPEGNKVSTSEMVEFNSTSENMDERKRNVQIALSGTGFDRNKVYKLVIKDVTQKPHSIFATHSVVIDLAFEDDFF